VCQFVYFDLVSSYAISQQAAEDIHSRSPDTLSNTFDNLFLVDACQGMIYEFYIA
jgi:hypothetical protein